LAQAGVSHVVRVAPGRETVARFVQVPGGDEAGLLAAVSLLAEAELPSNLASYRRAAGVLPMEGLSDMRPALLTGWMNGSSAPDAVSPIPEAWTTPAAALALLRSDAARAAVYTEPTEGLVCLLVPGPERSVARVLVEQPTADETWTNTVTAAVIEAAQMAGAPSAYAQSLSAECRTGRGVRLHLEPASLASIRMRVSGLREDRGWLDDFGIAIGALLVAGSDLATVRALAGLHARAPEVERSILEVASEWLGRPRNAWATVAAACALMLLGPLGLAGARKTILEHRARQVQDLRVGAEGLEKKAAMYDQFNASRWPMTKLLADVAQATPVGIVVTNLQITNGQGLVLQGTADSTELVNTLEANLEATRVFGSVSLNRVDTKSESVTEFDVSAKVVQPSALVKITEQTDFAANPLAARLYGQGASNTAPPSGASREDRGDRGDRGGRRRDRGERSTDAGGNGGDRGDRESRRPAPSTPSEPPAPLSDADIAKMDFMTAVKEWASRQSYVQKNPTLAAGVKQRLNDEVAKLKDQRDKMKNKAPEPAPAATASPSGGPAAPAGGAAPASAPAPPPATGGKP
jgi:Tfp pilus assembly protein PilN